MSKTPAKVLVVDDEVNIREALASILENEGYQVKSSASAEEAMAILGQDYFQVVVSDMRMGGGSGLEPLSRLHHKPASCLPGSQQRPGVLEREGGRVDCVISRPRL